MPLMPPIRLALLLCDEIHITSVAFKGAQGDYADIFRQFLFSSLRRITSKVTFTLDTYDVAHDMTYPPDDVHYDGILISGSRASPADQSPWIIKLVEYIKHVFAEKPHLRIFGVCFGHQVICRALGSPVTRGEWEASVTSVHLSSVGKALFHANQLHLQYCHQDQVVGCPPNAHLLGSTHAAPNQGIVVFEHASVRSPKDVELDARHISPRSIRVLTFQGHFEFTESIMRHIMSEFSEVLGPALAEDALLRIGRPTDSIDRIGRVIWGMLGVTSERTRVTSTVRARL